MGKKRYFDGARAPRRCQHCRKPIPVVEQVKEKAEGRESMFRMYTVLMVALSIRFAFEYLVSCFFFFFMEGLILTLLFPLISAWMVSGVLEGPLRQQHPQRKARLRRKRSQRSKEAGVPQSDSDRCLVMYYLPRAKVHPGHTILMLYAGTWSLKVLACMLGGFFLHLLLALS